MTLSAASGNPERWLSNTFKKIRTKNRALVEGKSWACSDLIYNKTIGTCQRNDGFCRPLGNKRVSKNSTCLHSNSSTHIITIMHLITVWIVAVHNAEKKVNITKVLNKKDTSSNINPISWRSYYLYSPNAYMKLQMNTPEQKLNNSKMANRKALRQQFLQGRAMNCNCTKNLLLGSNTVWDLFSKP